MTEDRKTDWVESDVRVHRYSHVILNATLLKRLGIILEDTELGFWRFFDDPPERLRKSAKSTLFEIESE